MILFLSVLRTPLWFGFYKFSLKTNEVVPMPDAELLPFQTDFSLGETV